MVGFYDELKASRPPQIQNLWPQSPKWWEHKGRKFGNFDSCTLAEHLDVWATDDEMNALMNGSSTSKSNLDSLVNTFADAADQMIAFLQLVQKGISKGMKVSVMLAEECSGINCNYDENYRSWGDFEYESLEGNLESFCQIIITTLGVANHLLLRDDADPLLRILGNFRSDWKKAYARGQPTIMDKLVLLVNGSFSVIPKVGIAAATTLSLSAARWPRVCFQNLSDPASLVSCIEKYMDAVMDDITNHSFLVQLNWGLIAFTRIIPLLYRLGSWKLVMVNLSSISEKIAVFANVMNSKIEQGEGCHDSDCRPLLEQFLSQDDIEESFGPLAGNPTFAVVCALEILARWAAKGVVLEAGTLQKICGEDGVKFQPLTYQYEPRLNYVKPLLGTFDKSDTSQDMYDEKNSLLYKPLQMAMKCGLDSCRGKKRSDGGDSELLPACAGCNGLEVYCCRSHQKEDWSQHKQFCKGRRS